jgi:hypothetical protein
MDDQNVRIRDPDDWRKWFCTDETVKIMAMEPHKLGWLMGFDKLTPLHSEWIRYIWDSNEKRALQSFRGSYKTTAVVVTGAVRWMLFRPNDRILLTRKTFKASSEVMRAISQGMQLQQIRELFKYVHGKYPKPVVDREGALKYNFKSTITPEGNMTAMGSDSGVTGLHFDKVIKDDVITLKDRISKAERLRTIEMLYEIDTNIVDPGKGSATIGTPWHREDAWKIVNSICPIARYPISQFSTCPYSGRVIISPEEIEKKKKTTTPYLYAANYELELQKDESLLFSEPIFSKGWDFGITGAKAQLDAAYDGTHYCALTIAAPKGKISRDGQIYQAIGFCYAGNVKNWIPEIVKLCRKYRVGTIYVETNPDKGYTADKLAEFGINVKSYGEGMNKHLKISTYLFDVWQYLEWDPNTDEEYMAQVMDYKEGIQPDDAPDSAASLFREGFPRKRVNIRAAYEW